MQREADETRSKVQLYRDSHNQVWRAFERAKFLMDGRSIAILVFESGVSFRCVRTYPKNWRELSPEALEALSWQV